MADRGIVLISYAEAKAMEADFAAARRARDEAVQLNGLWARGSLTRVANA